MAQKTDETLYLKNGFTAYGLNAPIHHAPLPEAKRNGVSQGLDHLFLTFECGNVLE